MNTLNRIAEFAKVAGKHLSTHFTKYACAGVMAVNVACSPVVDNLGQPVKDNSGKQLYSVDRNAAAAAAVGVLGGFILGELFDRKRSFRRYSLGPKTIYGVPRGYVTQSGPARRPRCHFRDGHGMKRRIPC